ncbi:MAG: DNA primase [Spirochaetia bacterium]|nr:DNA primase [Spirochaetia bacterium]
MAKISQNVIEEIKSKISIVELVSRYLTLNKKGDRYWGLCPFHDEKTPSFSVLADKGFFHCFGCGKSGSLFDFFMEMEHVNFPESIKILGESVGIQIAEESESEKKIRSEKETLLDLYNKLAASFTYILTNSDFSKGANEYLNHRDISKESIDKFQLGYAPNDPDWLYSFLHAKKYSDELLRKSGLFSKNNDFYPLFRDRLMFPIKNWRGEVVAFGGRDLSDTSKAKYINTPETLLYRKREIVYGLYESLVDVKKEASVILCEGYFDVIAMHQGGLTTAVAPLGTAFTEDQGKLIRRYATTITTLFDGDAAGREATKKALVVCERLGITNRVISLEGAKDPSELLEKEGEKALLKACSDTKSGFDYLVHSYLSLYDSTKATGKLQIFNELVPFLDAVDSQIVQQTYLRELSRYLQIDESTLIHEMRNKGAKRPAFQREAANTFSSQGQQGTNYSQDLYTLLVLVNNRSLFYSARNRLKISDLIDSEAITIYTLLEDAIREGTIDSDELILQGIENPSLRNKVSMSFQSKEFSKNPQKVIDELLKRISIRTLEKSQKNLEKLIAVASKNGTISLDISDLLYEKKAIDEKIAMLRLAYHHK